MRLSEVRTNIQHVLDANNNGDHPPMIFALKEAGGRFHVYASRRRDEAGDYVPYDSPLDTIISIEPKERNENEFLHELFAILLSRTNTSIGRVSSSLIHSRSEQRIKTGGENRAARELLLQYFLETEGERSVTKHSWHLICRGITESCGLTPYHVDSSLPEHVERRWMSLKTKPTSSGLPYPLPAGVRGLFGAPSSVKNARDAGQ
jgi:hypothetical protein